MRGFILFASISMAAVPAPAPAGATEAASPAAQATAPAAKPKRINRAIEVLEAGQPVYQTQIEGGGYEDGKRMADTKSDYITYDMEHGPFDIIELRAFMKGLADAAATRTGHRTPTVIATMPALGDDPQAMKANVWMAQQILAAGVHGILLCQAESPEAVRIFVEAIRYPFAPGADPNRTHRGSGSQNHAATIWGVTPEEYLRLADTWPLNPEGELLIGIKIENPRASAKALELASIPGLAFAEWGPGDQSFYRLGRPTGKEGGARYRADHPIQVKTRAEVLAATKKAGIKFLNICTEDDVIEQIKEGTMICTNGHTPVSDKGRAYTKRSTPW